MKEQKNPWMHLLLMLIPLGIGTGCILLCKLTERFMIFAMVAFIMLLPVMVCIINFIDAFGRRKRKKKDE